MPAEIIDKLYEIAQKGGYAGDQPAHWEGGIAAITSAITHDAPVLRDTVVDALNDLKAVAFEGGGGGGELGALTSIHMLDAEPVGDRALSDGGGHLHAPDARGRSCRMVIQRIL